DARRSGRLEELPPRKFGRLCRVPDHGNAPFSRLPAARPRNNIVASSGPAINAPVRNLCPELGQRTAKKLRYQY
ncbi:MAG: hypothetical protein MUF25_22715, partial [Pirellulaceae bacterium]|nr:hypothetical protein [Pirellulaceae bacterium]